jgi:tRNA threonylcarbamoyladenosine biosynthesis protein TsaE
MNSGTQAATDSCTAIAYGPAGTARVAAVLAGRLMPGDVVLLIGSLAAGKTTFVKAVAEALDSPDPVTSPTFSLAQFYSCAAGSILHIDAYRLADVDEYHDLGLDDYVESCITLVEWGDTIASGFGCALSVELRPSDDPDVRQIRFASSCDRWVAAMPGLERDLS